MWLSAEARLRASQEGGDCGRELNIMRRESGPLMAGLRI